jgi:hypothetical protein
LPLSSEPLKAERRGAVNRFFAIIRENEGEGKPRILALGRLAIGVKKSTIYDYYETLRDAGRVVEEDGQVWTASTYDGRVQQKISAEAEAEKRLTATITLDAYDLSRE